MPRTGGVFSLLSGSKGTPNTTIQSAPYNAQLDDFVQDANLARPITAGGTGATNATAARANLGLAVGSDVQAYDAGLQSIAGLTTAADLMIYATAADAYATTALTPFARTILDDADAATVRGTLGLGSMATQNSGAVSITGGNIAGTHTGNGAGLTNLNGSNIATGTVADARLPSTMGGKTFTGTTTFQNGIAVATNASSGIELGRTDGIASTPYIDFHSTATAVDYNVRLIVNGGSGASGDGTLNIITGTNGLQNSGYTVWHAGNDGIGSGLDADLLDGQQGSYYLDIGNATGNLSTARVPWISAYARTILDDTDGLSVFNTLGATRSFGQTGQFRLPDGVIVKWGQATAAGGNQTILFPSAFPNVAYACVLSCINEPGSNSVAYLAWQDGLNAGGFNARTRYMVNGGTVDASDLVFQYIAIGR